MSRLTRPQIRFIHQFQKFKADMESGKKFRPSSGLNMSGTPEEIHARMWPKIQKQKEEGMNAEIAAAERVVNIWEKKHKRIL